MTTDNIKEAGFNKRRPSKEIKELPKPQSAFTPGNTDLLSSIAIEEDILKTNNKSIVVPASVWCEYMALLDTTDNDYTYELMEELIHERKARFSHEEKELFEKNLNRKNENERYKLEKKLEKKKK